MDDEAIVCRIRQRQVEVSMNTELPRVNEIIDLDNENRLGYYCKGHWQPWDFGAGAKREYGEEVPLNQYSRFRHTYGRVVSNWENNSRTSCVLLDVDKKRGAFPVTILD